MDNSEFINLYIENLTKMCNDLVGKLVITETKLSMNEKLAKQAVDQSETEKSEFAQRIQQLEDEVSNIRAQLQEAERKVTDSRVIINDLNKQLSDKVESTKQQKG